MLLRAYSQLTLEGEELENVIKFIYLGSEIDSEESLATDINSRIGKARSAFDNIKKIWASNQHSRKTKFKIYRSNVLSVLMQGVESWKINERNEKKLNAFHNKCLSRIMRIFWPNVITNSIKLSGGKRFVTSYEENHRRLLE